MPVPVLKPVDAPLTVISVETIVAELNQMFWDVMERDGLTDAARRLDAEPTREDWARVLVPEVPTRTWIIGLSCKQPLD